jgi:hypothetical protein
MPYQRSPRGRRSSCGMGASESRRHIHALRNAGLTGRNRVGPVSLNRWIWGIAGGADCAGQNGILSDSPGVIRNIAIVQNFREQS